jgi:glycine cleavage system H protein
VESVKAASDIYSPVTGSIININEELEKKPGLLNSSPLEKGICQGLKL